MSTKHAHKGTWWSYLAGVLVLLLDQASKNWATRLYGGVDTLIPGWLAVRVLRQKGGLLGGWGLDGMWFAITFLAMGLLIFLAMRTPAIKKMRHFGFACMIGGALGNLTDRLVRGYVIDFIELRPLPVFNLADGALALGILLIAGDLCIKTCEDD